MFHSLFIFLADFASFKHLTNVKIPPVSSITIIVIL